MCGICNPERVHGKASVEGHEVHQHTTHEPEAFPYLFRYINDMRRF